MEKTYYRVEILLRRWSRQNRPRDHLSGKFELMGPEQHSAPSNNATFCAQVHFIAEIILSPASSLGAEVIRDCYIYRQMHLVH